MGRLINGRWSTVTWERSDTGDFRREQSTFRDWIEPDSQRFLPEPDRYHLYVSLACPWAHRTIIFRRILGLDACIGLSTVDPLMLDDGWLFDKPDPVNNCTLLRDVYLLADANCTTRVTVPLLWDKKHKTIVNNESSEIIRMFNSSFDSLIGPHTDYYPKELRAEIDAVNERIYGDINNGVYRCGFATTQTAYQAACDRLFSALDELEARLSQQRYLLGNQITEADWRLFTTLVRFDVVYHGHFKCNRRAIANYPNLWAYTRDLYQQPGIAETVDFHHIKDHYYRSHLNINPTGIVPLGPELDWWLPHGREHIH